MSGSTPPPADDLRDRIAKALVDVAHDFGHADAVVVSTAKAADAVLALDTEVHVRNASLRAEVRKLTERVAEVTELNQGWSRYGDRVKAERRQWADSFRAALGLDDPDRTRHIPLLIEKVADLRIELEAADFTNEHVTDRLSDMMDDAGLARPENLVDALDAVYTLITRVDQRMVRDLHAAQFDGATLLPDRPLATTWAWLLDLVRKDRARLSAGSPIPDDAAVDRVALFLLRTKVYGTNRDAHYDTSAATQWQRVLTDAEREHWRDWARVLLADLQACSNLLQPLEQASAATPKADGPGEVRALRAELRLEEDNVEFIEKTLHLVLRCCDGEQEDCRELGPVYASVRAGEVPVPPAVGRNYLCLTHWARYHEGWGWWDRHCPDCDLTKARRAFGDEAPALPAKSVFVVDAKSGMRSVTRPGRSNPRFQYGVFPVPPSGATDPAPALYRPGRKNPGATVYRHGPGDPPDGALVAVAFQCPSCGHGVSGQKVASALNASSDSEDPAPATTEDGAM